MTRLGSARVLPPAAAVAAALLLAPAPSAAQDPTVSGPAEGSARTVVLDVEEAVRIALRRSRSLRDARLGLEVAEEQVSEAWGEVYPSVDLSARYNRNLSPNVSFLPAIIFDPDADPDEQVAVQFGATNTWNSSIDLVQPLLSPRSFVAIPAAARFRELQGEVVRGRAQEVATEVRNTYYDLLLAQEQVRLTRNSILRVEETLTETRALNRAGLASDFDVLRLEVELDNLTPNLLRAANAEAAARRTLAVELDLDGADSLRVEGSLATLDLDEPGANSPANRTLLEFTGVEVLDEEVAGGRLVERAADASSALRQSRLVEELRETELRLEQSDYLPTLSLFGTYAIQAQQNGDPEFFGGTRAYTRNAGLQLSFPVFDGFRRDAQIDQRRASLRQARTQTELARDRTRNEVLTLLDQAREALARARAQERAVERARRGYEIGQAQYREGLGSRLELTDAEVALRESEFNYAQAVYDFLVARANLDRAVGLVPVEVR